MDPPVMRGRKTRTIVSQNPHGLCQRPLGVGVCGVASVVDGKAGDKFGILEVQVELWYHS